MIKNQVYLVNPQNSRIESWECDSPIKNKSKKQLWNFILNQLNVKL
jgi:hypothetical protein